MKNLIICIFCFLFLTSAQNSFAEADKIKSTLTKEAEQAAQQHDSALKAEVVDQDEQEGSLAEDEADIEDESDEEVEE